MNDTPQPGLPGPVVRDFLYVDLSRTRSLLAQIARGAPEEVTEKLEGAWRLAAGLHLGLVDGNVGRTSGSDSSETRSMTDVHFALFEEATQALDLLTDVTELASNSANWFGGRIQAELLEGQLIRVSGVPVRLVDSRFVGESLDRMEKLLDSWAEVMLSTASNSTMVTPSKRTGGGSSGSLNRGERDRARAKLKRDTFGGATPEMLTGIKNIMDSVLEGDGISVRVMPAGEAHPECSFTGTLLNRSEYIESERSAIFARLGLRPTEWTMVAIVSRFAPEKDAEEFTTPEGFDRIALETMAIGLMDRLERLGLSAAPSFPGIAVIPLALYRILPWKSPT